MGLRRSSASLSLGHPTPHTELGAVVECLSEAFGDDGAALADLFGLLLRCTFDEKIVRVP